jgi:hypothetical protein
MKKQQILERLSEMPEGNVVWNGISAAIAEYEELTSLQWLYEEGAMDAYGNSERAGRLHELERRFGV